MEGNSNRTTRQPAMASPLAIAAMNGLSSAAPAHGPAARWPVRPRDRRSTVVREGRHSLLLGSAQGDELDLLAAQLDLKLIAGLQA